MNDNSISEEVNIVKYICITIIVIVLASLGSCNLQKEREKNMFISGIERGLTPEEVSCSISYMRTFRSEVPLQCTKILNNN